MLGRVRFEPCLSAAGSGSMMFLIFLFFLLDLMSRSVLWRVNLFIFPMFF